VSDPVTYTAVLPAPDETVLFVSGLLAAERRRRGISDVIASAYLQLAAPGEQLDPYEVLDIRPGAPLEVVEAAYKAKMRIAHPDSGGSIDEAKRLNTAIERIRKEAA
jgi:hypothetical protein